MNETKHPINARADLIAELNLVLRGHRATYAFTDEEGARIEGEGVITEVHGMNPETAPWVKVDDGQNHGQVYTWVGGHGKEWMDVTWAAVNIDELTGYDFEGDLPYCLHCLSTGTESKLAENGFETYRICGECGNLVPADIWEGEDDYSDLIEDDFDPQTDGVGWPSHSRIK